MHSSAQIQGPGTGNIIEKFMQTPCLCHVAVAGGCFRSIRVEALTKFTPCCLRTRQWEVKRTGKRTRQIPSSNKWSRPSKKFEQNKVFFIPPLSCFLTHCLPFSPLLFLYLVCSAHYLILRPQNKQKKKKKKKKQRLGTDFSYFFFVSYLFALHHQICITFFVCASLVY